MQGVKVDRYEVKPEPGPNDVGGWLAEIEPWGRKAHVRALAHCACGKPLMTWLGALRGTCADCAGVRRRG